MKNEMRVKKTLVYTSEIDPRVETSNEDWAKIIEWADELVVPHKIVNSSRCLTYGFNANAHLGWARSSASSEAILTRLEKLKHDYEQRDWYYGRARFAVENFEKKGFSSGLMQQHALWKSEDKSEVEYSRACCYIDYTPKTLETIIDGFCGWMNSVLEFENTTRITLDGKNVRTFEPHFGRLLEIQKQEREVRKGPARGRARKEKIT